MLTRPVLTTLALAVVLLTGATAPAEDEGGREVLRTRIFDVSALTQGIPDFLRPVLAMVSPDSVSDEENPLFGAEGEEPNLPAGTIDEIVELIRREVDPVSWEVTEGAGITTQGEHLIVVRAHRPVLDGIARYVAGLEAELLRSYVVDVRAVSLSDTEGRDLGAGGPGRALDPKAASALLGQGGLALSLTAIANQQVVGFAGRERAYVQDYDVEVAKGSTSSDPIVGVQLTGIAAAARVSSSSDDSRIRLRLDAALSIDGPWLRHSSGPQRLIELPRADLVEVNTQVLMRPGLWHAAEGAVGGSTPGRYLFLLRVRPVATRPSRPRDGDDFTWPAPDTGPLELRSFDLADLARAVSHEVGPVATLIPSNFTPPEPPELPEPMPIYAEDGIVDLLREIAAPRTWKREGSFLEARNRRLYARNTARVLDAIQDQIDRIRNRFLYDLVMEVRAVRVEPALAEALLAGGLAGGVALGERGEAALRAAMAGGEAELLDDVRVVSLSGVRNNVLVGRQVPYIHDYEVEIADEADIGNPVVQSVLSGTVVDLKPALTSTRDAVLVDVRITRTRLAEPVRELDSPFGPIQLPDLGSVKLRMGIVAPLGTTSVLGLGKVEREGAVLLLMKPTLRPYDG